MSAEEVPTSLPTPALPVVPELTEAEQRQRIREGLRVKMRGFKVNTVDKSVHRELERGWLLPYLMDFDDLVYGRWEYWFASQSNGKLLDEPIPQMDFMDTPDSGVTKMLEKALDCIPTYGSWRGWSGSENFVYFLDWFLYGVGQLQEEPSEPPGCEGASDRLYQVFNACAMQLWPYDYLGDLLAETGFGKGLGFYPTPMSLCKLIIGMTMGDGSDMRLKTVCDPCIGTGRMALLASNYSLRLYGQDISHVMVKTTLVNGFLYAPWMVRPLHWLTDERVLLSTDSEPEDEAPNLMRGNSLKMFPKEDAALKDGELTLQTPLPQTAPSKPATKGKKPRVFTAGIHQQSLFDEEEEG